MPLELVFHFEKVYLVIRAALSDAVEHDPPFALKVTVYDPAEALVFVGFVELIVAATS